MMEEVRHKAIVPGAPWGQWGMRLTESYDTLQIGLYNGGGAPQGHCPRCAM